MKFSLHSLFRTCLATCAVCLIGAGHLHAQAVPGGQAQDLNTLRQQIEALKADYEKRVQELQKQLDDIQSRLLRLPESEPQLTPAPAPAPPAQTTFSALNPAISVIGNFLGRMDNQDVLSPEGTRIDDSLNLR